MKETITMKRWKRPKFQPKWVRVSDRDGVSLMRKLLLRYKFGLARREIMFLMGLNPTPMRRFERILKLAGDSIYIRILPNDYHIYYHKTHARALRRMERESGYTKMRRKICNGEWVRSREAEE